MTMVSLQMTMVSLSPPHSLSKKPRREDERRRDRGLSGRSLLYAANAAKDVHSCVDALPRKSVRENHLGGKLVPCTVLSRYRSVSSLGGQIAKEDRHDTFDVSKHVWACCECLLKISGGSAFPEGRSVEGRSRIGPFSPKCASPTVDIVRPEPMSQDEQPQQCRLAGALLGCALAYVRDRNVGVYV